MKNVRIALLVGALAVLTGCNQHTTSGGPGASKLGSAGTNKPLVGQGEETFSLKTPLLSTKIKQGETKTVNIDISRGKNFDQDVTLKLHDLPKGVTIDPASPVIKHGDKEAKLTVKAADDAALGDFTVKVTGHPAKGADAESEFKLTVDKK